MILAHQKGFTLIELLIVIAIIAILATAVILLLNPAALLAQARDSQRISDMDTLRSAIALYQSTTGGSITPASGTCYVYTGAPANCAARYVSAAIPMVTSASRAVGNGSGGGLGWLPIDFAATPGGSPLAVLPIDPRNGVAACGVYTSGGVVTGNGTRTCFYSFVGTSAGTFELNADMESARYACGSATDDAEATDGGDRGTIGSCDANAMREVGNAPGLAL